MDMPSIKAALRREQAERAANRIKQLSPQKQKSTPTLSTIFPHGPAEIGGDDSPEDENPSVLAHLLGPMDHADLSYDPDAAWAKLRSRQIFQAPATVEAAVGGRPAGSVRVVAVSDTHGLHRGVALPRGDILVHCGDFTDDGMPNQVRDFTLWLLEAKAAGGFAHVVVIAGNHDTTFHESYYRETGADRFHRRAHGAVDPVATKAILTTATHGDNSGHATSTSPSSPSPPPNGITYLEDELVALPFAHLGPHPSSGGGGGGARVPLGAPLSSAQAAAAAAAAALASAPAALAARAAATAAATAAAAAAVVTVYGTPWQPEFGGWAFNLDRGPPCRAVWDRIPAAHPSGGGDATGGEDGGGGGGETSRGTIGGSDSGSGNGSSSSSSLEAAAPRRAVDVLLSHGPPLGRGDRLGLPVAAGLPAAGPAAGLQGLEEEEEEVERRRSGCVDLLRRVQGAVQTLAHVFGHIHEGAGEVSGDGATAYANASTCTFHYQSLNPAIVFDLVFDLVFDDGHGGGGHGGGGHGGGGHGGGGGNDGGGSDSGGNDSGENDGGSGRGRGPHPHALPPLRPSRVTFVASRVRGWGASRVGVWLDAQAAALLAQAQAADPAGAGVGGGGGGGGGGGRPRVTADAGAVDAAAAAAAETATATATATAAAAAAAAGPGSASWLLPCAAAVVALRGLDGPGLLALRPDDARLRPLERQATARTIRAVRHLEAAETN